jgi:VanZ family protein
VFRRRIALAILASLLVILSAPFAQLLFTEATTRWPARARLLGIAATVAPAAALLVVAVVRIRSRYALRYAALVAALVISAAYTTLAGLTFSEAFHFAEYGLLALLFYRAWRPHDDVGIVVLPLLAGLLTGIADEWFQWFIPIRAGEARDVALNVVALGCGLLFAIALDPPPRLLAAPGRESRRHLALVGAAAIVAFAVFFEAVHLGYVITDEEIGTFDSRYTWDTLVAVRDQRTVEWRTRPPIALRRMSREDQYLSEGMFHVQWRNRMWSEGRLAAAWWENRILETYYAPVLDTPSYISATGHRWPAEQRAHAADASADAPWPYVSDAHPVPVYAWPWPLFWGGHLAIAGLIAFLCRPFSS